MDKPIPTNELAYIQERNIRKRFHGKSPVIETLPNGQKLVRLKMRKNKNWIHR